MSPDTQPDLEDTTMASKLPKEFFIGGNCTMTVKVPEAFASHHGCNLHYTFKIEQSEPSDKFPTPAHFVKLLTGSDNTSDYSYLGVLNPLTGQVRLTARSCAGETAWAVRIIRRVLAQVFEGEGMQAIIAQGWDVHHEGRCGRCARPLTVPESIEIGIGPDCAEIMGIPYPTRTKAKKPRVKKEKVAAPVAWERAAESDQEPPQVDADVRAENEAESALEARLSGGLPALPADDEVWF